MKTPEGSVTVLLNGAPDPQLMFELQRVVVESSLHMPGMVEIHIADQQAVPPAPLFARADSATLRIGSMVAVSFSGYGPTSTPRPIFKGSITALEPSFDSQGARMVVRGYDALHKLHMGTKTRVHRGSEGQIIQKILAESGIARTSIGTLARRAVRRLALRLIKGSGVAGALGMGARDQTGEPGLVGDEDTWLAGAIEVAGEAHARHQVAASCSSSSISRLSGVGTIERIWQTLPA